MAEIIFFMVTRIKLKKIIKQLFEWYLDYGIIIVCLCIFIFYMSPLGGFIYILI